MIKITKRIPSQTIIINYPGFNGSLNGYENKYAKLAKFMNDLGFAFIQMSNPACVFDEYPYEVERRLRNVVQTTLENSGDICGYENPSIGLIGWSAGASAIAAVAHEFSQVNNIILFAPSMDAANWRNIKEYIGKLTIISGLDDEVVGDSWKTFYSLAYSSHPETILIDRCDHHFSGTKNGISVSRIIAQSFTGDESIEGIELY